MCRHMMCAHGVYTCVCTCTCVHVCTHVSVRDMFPCMCVCAYMICGCVCVMCEWDGGYTFVKVRERLFIFLCEFSMEFRSNLYSNCLSPIKKHRQIKTALYFRQIINFHTCYSFLKDIFVLSYVHMRVCVSVYTPECAVEIRRGYQIP